MRRHMGNVNAFKDNLTAANRSKTDHRPDQSRLPHSVPSENGNHRPLSHLERNSLKNIAIAIVSMNIDRLKHKDYPSPK